MASKRFKILKNYTVNNRVQLVRSGKDYFNTLVNTINKAQESIHLQTYVFSNDETGQFVAKALKEAALRGVKVYLLADAYASQGLSKDFIEGLTYSGINFRFFEPLFRSKYFYFGRRLHHKVTVIDVKYAIVGGINIANRYNDIGGEPAWLDFALLVEGEVVKELCVLCWKTWEGFKVNVSTPCYTNNFQFTIPANESVEVKMCRNDWIRRKNEITATYVSMLRNASKEVTILCSYFLPGKVIRKQMLYAIKRGVTIRVVAAGRSDVEMMKYAERWLYDWLLRNGIHLYEYNKNILHAKVSVCDDEWMTIGSYNINNISAYASIELNLDVRNASFSQSTRLIMEKIIAEDCVRITPARLLAAKNIFNQFMGWLSYQLFRLIFYLFTFYFKRRN